MRTVHLSDTKWQKDRTDSMLTSTAGLRCVLLTSTQLVIAVKTPVAWNCHCARHKHTHSYLRRWTEVNSQLHAPAALPRWSSQPIWAFWSRETYLDFAKDRTPDRLVRSQVTILTALSRLRIPSDKTSRKHASGNVTPRWTNAGFSIEKFKMDVALRFCVIQEHILWK